MADTQGCMTSHAVNPAASAPGRRSGAGTESISAYLVQSRGTQPVRETAPAAACDLDVIRLSTAALAHAELMATYQRTVQEARDAVERYRATVDLAHERVRAALGPDARGTNGRKAA